MFEKPKPFPKIDGKDKYGVPVFGAYKDYYVKVDIWHKDFVAWLRSRRPEDLNNKCNIALDDFIDKILEALEQ